MFNVGSISRQQLMEILDDHRTDLAALEGFKQFSHVRPVKAMKGSLYLWDTPVGVPSSGGQTSKVSPGQPTPQGNLGLGTVDYTCHEFALDNPLPKSAQKEIAAISGADLSELVRNASLKVLRDFNADIATLLKGDDADYAITERTINDKWDTSSATPIEDVDAIVKALRGGGELTAVVGWDVASALSKAAKITGSSAGSGREYVNFEGVAMFLRERGIKNVWIDGSAQQNGEPNFARSYNGVYDGVFAVFPRNALITALFTDLDNDVFEDKKTRSVFHHAEFVAGAARSRATSVIYGDTLTA